MASSAPSQRPTAKRAGLQGAGGEQRGMPYLTFEDYLRKIEIRYPTLHGQRHFLVGEIKKKEEDGENT